VVGCPRGADLQDEQTCVAFLPEKFNLMKLDSYWLSPTPYVPGSRYEVQSPCPRICTEVTLHQLSTNKVFRLTNTHLDHEGQPARMLGIHQILNKMNREPFFRDVPSILTGDMNAEPDSEEIRFLSAQAGMQDLTAGIGGTYHAFGQVDPIQIDYIFAAGAVRCSHVQKWTDCENGVYLSDHYPVCVEIEL